MKNIKNYMNNLMRDESGQGTVEYILILVGVVALAFAFKDQIIGIAKEKMGQLGSNIQSFTP